MRINIFNAIPGAKLVFTSGLMATVVAASFDGRPPNRLLITFEVFNTNSMVSINYTPEGVPSSNDLQPMFTIQSISIDGQIVKEREPTVECSTVCSRTLVDIIMGAISNPRVQREMVVTFKLRYKRVYSNSTSADRYRALINKYYPDVVPNNPPRIFYTDDHYFVISSSAPKFIAFLVERDHAGIDNLWKELDVQLNYI